MASVLAEGHVPRLLVWGDVLGCGARQRVGHAVGFGAVADETWSVCAGGTRRQCGAREFTREGDGLGAVSADFPTLCSAVKW